MAEGVVKIDADLLKKVEFLIKKNKIKYSSKKQFIDLAVLNLINQETLLDKERNLNKVSFKKEAFIKKN